MLDFKLLNHEKINSISHNTLLKYHDEVGPVSDIITNQQFLIF